MFMRFLFIIFMAESCAQTPIRTNWNPDTKAPYLVSLSTVTNLVQIEMKYLGADNFVGEVVNGYYAHECLLTQSAAKALATAANKLAQTHPQYRLKVFDCYRPQRAVDHFMEWAKRPILTDHDRAIQSKYYPRIFPKTELFKGYIAEKSGHTRGSTIDVYLVKRNESTQSWEDVDMGSIPDLLDSLSHTQGAAITDLAQKNRLFLKSLLESVGLQNYKKEWWHFTFRPEEFPATYFDFPVGKP